MLQEPVDFTITVNRPGLLHKIGIRKKKRKFSIYPLVVGTMLRMTKEISKLNVGELNTSEKGDLFAKAFESMEVNLDKLVDIVALAIHNRKGAVPKSLRRFLINNISNSELFKLVSIVASQVNVQGFLYSIILIKGMSLVKEGETIAPGESSDQSKNTSGSD